MEFHIRELPRLKPSTADRFAVEADGYRCTAAVNPHYPEIITIIGEGGILPASLHRLIKTAVKAYLGF